MKTRIASTLLAVASLLAASDAGAVAAFPGAEGWGSGTVGGRGGAVYFVDSLDDDPEDPQEGTLRYAIEQSGSRIVVFRIGGTIVLNDYLEITNPYITIAGQSAPGGGIQIRNNPDGYGDLRLGMSRDNYASIKVSTHDVVIRYLRLRPGPENPNPLCTQMNAVPPPEGWTGAGTCVDQNNITALSVTPSAYNVVLDHLSLYWGSDEVVEIVGATDVTLQNSIVAEGLNYVLYDGYYNKWAYNTPLPQPPFKHSKGIITGDTHTARTLGEATARLSMHHNLWAHFSARAPQMGAHCSDPQHPEACFSDVVNNVSYDWAEYAVNIHNFLGHHYSNLIGNYFKQPPALGVANAITMNDWTDYDERPNGEWVLIPDAEMSVYFSDNRVAAGQGSVAASVNCVYYTGASPNPWSVCNLPDYQAAQPFATAPITTTSADTAYTNVLASAGAYRLVNGSGAWVAARDAADARVVLDVQQGTGGLIDDLNEFQTLGGHPTLASGSAYTDSDDDGMPDTWEEAQCLNKNVANSANDPDGDVYTNLEEYLNGTPATLDSDGDGVRNPCDNCQIITNPGQEDHDHDGIGTACEAACQDGVDNDGDGPVDYPADTGCTSAGDTSELEGPSCGLLGIELLPVLLFAALKRRTKRTAAA